MMLSLLLLAILVVPCNTAFHVGKFMSPTQTLSPHQVEQEFLRHDPTRVEKYTDKERAEWALPDGSKLRHSDDLPALFAEDRSWRNPPPKCAVLPSANGRWSGIRNQEYAPSDRTWRFPELRKIRHVDEFPSSLTPKDRQWRMPKPDQLLEK